MAPDTPITTQHESSTTSPKRNHITRLPPEIRIDIHELALSDLNVVCGYGYY
ncbi:hypothetical protein CLAFUW4_01345 [Fulvia fulva]|uniref:uncharacterized protein n=1 Tax=Passalora fulva TaxID=5499 RepID=UPI00285295D8|nr:uncharacterized protein CLAFUR5_20127 [Fulvia fulva]KAK4635855.1 hypothetical protein CLAFUR4_01346 [Fulvia fulva]KAK4638279.1 hypothetical protein CLAFUR0_01347 [Fulvia fulva]WMI38759.1 hypothetical protein CLAFUR5_20127 [Fulvia fulva]WPV10062.1 hypothetical protein CLAFUW4_01345 [Fulvia fulva]WPV24392.1 hypothetical protein CLAFUW7_01350 [Fulvia fulva]